MEEESHPYYKHPSEVDFMVAKNYLEYMMESYSWNDKMYFNEGLIKTYNPEFCIKRLQHEFDKNFGIKLIELHGNRNVDSNKSYIFINYPDNPLSDKYCNGIYSKIELGIYKIGMFIYVDKSQDSNLKNKEFEDAINFVCDFTGMYISNSKILDCEGGHICKFVIEPKFFDKEFELNKFCDIKFLYHLTKTSKVNRILKIGLNPKSTNPEFDYPDRVYLGINPIELEKDLLEPFKRTHHCNEYSILRIEISKIPPRVKFRIDPNYPNGVFTSENIPSNAISIFKEV